MNWKKILPYIGVILGFLLLSYAFVPEVLSGKMVNQSDISGWQGTSHEMMSWNSAHPDDQTAWTDSTFGGMPTVTIHNPGKGDWTQGIYDALLAGRRPATYLFVSLLGAFLLMLALGCNIWVAVGGAIAVTFCSYNMQIIQVGHNTKMQALAFLPWALAAFVFTYKKALTSEKWLFPTLGGAALFGLAMSFQVKANHPQITYYLALMLIIYGIVLLVKIIREKTFKRDSGRFATASALLIALGLVGVASNANKLLPIWEYTPYSMRGGSTKPADEGGHKGLDIDYATAWSYGWEELPNMLIADYNGGSSAGDPGPRSETVKLLRQAGQPNLDIISKQLPLYWGPQPFTAGPMYMGAVTIFLFLLGLFFFKGEFKWWSLACTVLAILLAVGNHFMAFTRLAYDYLPLYNKFRTVSMALIILQFMLPVLGFVTLDSILKKTDETLKLRKAILTSGAWTLCVTLVLCILQAMLGSFESAADAGQAQLLTDALRADRQNLLWRDCLRSLIFIALASAALVWCVSKDKRRPYGAALIAVLVLCDLFPMGKRYLNSDDFISPRNFHSQFNKRPVDEIILQDPDPSYRVLDLTVNVFNDSHPSFWHKNVGGYSPAKLQIYQEYIDNCLNSELQQLSSAMRDVATIEEAEEKFPRLEGLSKLNCRYVILDPQAPPVRNPYACGTAWFEQGEGTIEMISYAPNELRYRYSSPTGGKAVFSEVYYPEGWTLRCGERELEISCTDGLFRSAQLPEGEGELVMRFAPRSYSVGEKLSRGSSILLILLVLSCTIIPLARKWK